MDTPEKNKGGRPPKYATDAELLARIEDYFRDCDSEKKIPNKAGLRLALDISRETYNEYKTRFLDAMKIAEDTIEEAWTNRLTSPAATGAIFYMKNAFKEDYKDRHETAITDPDGKALPVTQINVVPVEKK